MAPQARLLGEDREPMCWAPSVGPSGDAGGRRRERARAESPGGHPLKSTLREPTATMDDSGTIPMGE